MTCFLASERDSQGRVRLFFGERMHMGGGTPMEIRERLSKDYGGRRLLDWMISNAADLNRISKVEVMRRLVRGGEVVVAYNG